MEDELARVEEEIARMAVSEFGALDEVGDHLLSTEGKLFRPSLVLLASRVSGPVPGGAVRMAAVVELVHLATLVHDDAVDHSVRRRGMPTVNSVWTHQVAVIMGDYLYSRAVTEMTELDDMEAVRILAEAANRMTVGEMRQLTSHEALDFSEEDYRELCRCKTASLISAACELGARLGSPGHAASLRAYGHDLGMAFQMADDVLDYTASSSETGKPRGQDLREHKVTLPLIAVLPDLSGAEREEVEALFGDPEPDDGRVARVIEIVEEHGGVEYARDRARDHAAGAREHLAEIPEGPALRSLQGAVEYVVRRRR